jgi:hypothetical protein
MGRHGSNLKAKSGATNHLHWTKSAMVQFLQSAKSDCSHCKQASESLRRHAANLQAKNGDHLYLGANARSAGLKNEFCLTRPWRCTCISR